MVSIILLIIAAALLLAPATDSYLPRQIGGVILLLVMGYWAYIVGSAAWSILPSLSGILRACEHAALEISRVALIVLFIFGYGIILMFQRLTGGGK